MTRFRREKPESPFRDVMRWGTLSDYGHSGADLEDWIETGGVFYAGARLAGATHDGALQIIYDSDLDMDVLYAEAEGYSSSDFGTLGYIAQKQMVGMDELDG